MKKRFRTMATASLAAVLFALFLAGCGRKEPITKTGFYFDTVISVTLYDPSKTKELEHCFALADQYESYFSAKREESDISKINTNAGKPVRVHEETLDLIQKGLAYSRLSQGKFDITIGKLTSLWDFHAQTPKLPDADAVKAAVDTIDYQKVMISGNEVTLADQNAALDLGGIAKGYIADQIKAYLRSEGITSGLINLGGNVLTIGTKTDGSAYTIGIQRPFDETGAPIASVSIQDQTVVTSGIYERCFTLDGRLYHHILDTDTGYPYESDLLSVSIICQDSADGDGLSTACFALGLEKGLALIESLEQTEAIFITSDYKLHGTSGIGTTIPIQDAVTS
ncbi:MAG: FAD:protein FMN transferase [Eubacterium sp.]|nr:FAD:protein FMN transferase [Eubacterium sp.]